MLGIVTPTDFHILQRGWNHQPDTVYVYVGSWKNTFFKQLILIWFAVALVIQYTATLIVNNIMFALFLTNI